MLVPYGEHDAVTKVIDESPAGGPAGQPGCFDQGVVMAEVTKVADKCSPSRWGVADVPLRRQRRMQAASREVTGDPAALEMADVEPFCVEKHTAKVSRWTIRGRRP